MAFLDQMVCPVYPVQTVQMARQDQMVYQV
jgi:hypothetical protein